MLTKTAFFVLLFFYCFYCFVLWFKINLLYLLYKSVNENIKRVTVWRVV